MKIAAGVWAPRPLRSRSSADIIAGEQWRANFYRIDYDQAPASQWAWCPHTGGNFHKIAGFGTLLFEGI